MPTPVEVITAWQRLDALHKADPDDRRAAGAHAAAAWTLGRADSNAAPITGMDLPPVGRALAEEPHYALMVCEGILPGDPDYAVGAAAWLFWYRDVEPLPRWLAHAITAESSSVAAAADSGM